MTITFTPFSAQVFDGTLTIQSNAPDEPVLTVPLHGEGLIPPDISVSPASLSENLIAGQTSTQALTVLNSGGSDLLWTIGTGLVESLEDVLAALDSGFSAVTDVIPNRFDFSEGVSGFSISDGGNDMYDGGNFLGTNLGGPLPYSEGVIVNSTIFGASGRYFTRKYPGLFVLVADMQGVSSFTVSGNLGADGSGIADGAVLESTIGGFHYRGFVKRVYAAGDPAVNHLVIVSDVPEATHEFTRNTDDDDHRVHNLGSVTRIYYLLYAGVAGTYIDDASTQQIMAVFLSPFGPAWLSVAPDAGTLAAGGSVEAGVSFDTSGLLGGDYETGIAVRSNDPDEPEVVVPVHLHVTGIPDIAVSGEEVSLESIQDYSTFGALTQHSLPVSVAPAGGGTFELIVDGEYGAFFETATATAEGAELGRVGATGTDCTQDSNTFGVSEAQLAALVADGVVQVLVQNTFNVDAFCAVNRHTVRLRYAGPADALEFGSLFVGLSRALTITLRNAGTDVLEVGSITSDLGEFVPSAASLSLPPLSSQSLTIVFTPLAALVFDGTLTIQSNAPDEPVLTVPLHGEGLIPPDISVSPASLTEGLIAGHTSTQTLTISNSGGSDLLWTIGEGPATLEDVLTGLDSGFSAVIDVIPNRFDFSEGVLGFSISAGGNHMYDGGNFLGTNLGGPLPYSDGVIVNSAICGAGGRYFTRKYPGLFVLAADMQGVSDFTIEGNLGADGSGFADGAVLESTVGAIHYRGFVKRVYNAFNPSVNHLVIVSDRPEVTHEFSSNTNDDHHRVRNLGSVTRVYYLLYAGSGGTYITDAATLEVMNRFVSLLGPGWLSVSPASGIVVAGASAELAVSFDASGLSSGNYDSSFGVSSNDPVTPRVTVPVTLTVIEVPDIRLSSAALDYDQVFIGQSRSLSLIISNDGADVLAVSNVSVDNAAFVVDATSFDLDVGQSRELMVTFSPTDLGVFEGTLTIQSNDPDEALLSVDLRGEGLLAPDIAVSPASFSEQLAPGGTSARTMTIQNTFGGELHWEIATDASLLEDVRSGLDSNFAAVTSAIPNRFDFGEAESGFYILDGGSNMFDFGNLLRTDLGGYLVYSSGTIVNSADFGAGGRYFTRKYPGLFVLAADMHGVSNFTIEGNLGADGHGEATGAMLQAQFQGNTYTGFLKEVSNPLTPSVYHLIIVPAAPGLAHIFSPTSDDDFHRLVGLAGSTRLYYLLFGGQPGTLIDSATALTIMEAFLGAIPPTWLHVEPTTGTLLAGMSADVGVTFDAVGLDNEDLDSRIIVMSNDPDEPEIVVPVHLHVLGAPHIEVSPAALDWGEVFIGGSRSLRLSISNVGTAPLDVNGISTNGDGFATDTTSLSLTAGESRDVIVTFAPTGAGPSAGTLMIQSNDPGTPILEVALHGVGVEPPVIEVQPSSLDVMVPAGTQTTRTMTIDNAGASPLEFSLQVIGRPPVGAPPEACEPNTALVVEYTSGELTAVDLQTGATGVMASGLGGPLGLVLSNSGSTAYVAGYDSGELYAVNLLTGEIAVVASGLNGPSAVALDSAGTVAYATEYASGELSAVDLSTGDTSVVAFGLSGPAGLTLVEDGTLAYVAEYDSGELSAVNLATGATSVVASALSGPNGVAFDPLRNAVHVVEYAGGKLSAVDLATGTTSVTAVDLAGPFGVALGPVGSALVTQYSGVLSSVELATGMVTDIAAGLDAPSGLGVRKPVGCSAEFLNMVPRSGSVAAGESTNALLELDATGLPDATYRADIRVASNDPLRSSMIVPVTLTVFSNRPPVADAGADVEAECTSPEGTPVTLDGSGSSDPDSAPGSNSDIVLFEWFEHFGEPEEHLLGPGESLQALRAVGPHVVTLRVTDSRGVTATDEMQVFISDTIPPTVQCPVDAILECPADTSPTVTGWATATDACGATVIDLEDESAQECGASQTLTRTWTATDAFDRTAICKQGIAVLDTRPPVFSTLPAVSTAQCDAVPPPEPPQAVDGCEGSMGTTLSEVRTDGSCPDSYTLLRTWNAGDGCGNTAAHVQTVTVVDTVPPAILLPEPITLECNGPGGISAADPRIAAWLGAVSSADNCTELVQATSNAPAVFPPGATPVTFTAIDACENSSTETSALTVVDTTPPAISLSVSPVLLWPPNHQMVSITASVSATDTCGPPSVVLTSVTSDESDDAPGEGDGHTTGDIQDAALGTADFQFRLRAEREGSGDGRTYTIVYTATDGAGHAVSVAAVVAVPRSMHHPPSLAIEEHTTPQAQADRPAPPAGQQPSTQEDDRRKRRPSSRTPKRRGK